MTAGGQIFVNVNLYHPISYTPPFLKERPLHALTYPFTRPLNYPLHSAYSHLQLLFAYFRVFFIFSLIRHTFHGFTYMTNHAYSFKLANNEGGGTLVGVIATIEEARRILLDKYGDRLLSVAHG